MNTKETSSFFEYLGEIWRDITAIEFLMRCAIAKHNGELDGFPKPPYTKGKIYKDPPDSFLDSSFGNTTSKFNELFPRISIPDELVQLRHAMAHGIIAEIDKEGLNKLIKFKKIKNENKIQVEFSMSLELQIIAQIRQSLKELRRYIMEELK